MPSSASEPILNAENRSGLIGSHALIIAVAAACIAVIGVVWFQLRSHAQEAVDARVNAAGNQFIQELNQELEQSASMLEMSRGYYESVPGIDKEAWAWFVRSTDIYRENKSLIGLGYIERITSDFEPLFIVEMRAQLGDDFAIRSHDGQTLDPNADSRYVVKYFEPAIANSSIWGLDVASQPMSKRIYDDSTGSGEARLSNFYPLSPVDSSNSTGATMCLPVYFKAIKSKTEPPAHTKIRGWVAITIDVNALVERIWKDHWSNLGIELASDDPGLGSSAPFAHRFEEALRSRPGSPLNIRETRFSIYGGELTLSWLPIDGWSVKPDMTAANLFLLVGSIMAAALITIVWVLSQTRRRAVALARQMTDSLRRSERSQRELAHQAERANLAKSMFLANMSHEIRTPMTAILGYVDLLNDQSNQISRDEATRTIRRAGNHLLRIINDVLDLSKIEAGHMTITQEACPLGDLLCDIMNEFEGNAYRKKVGLTLDAEGELPEFVVIDPHRFRQILTNLIGNAIKFTENGSVHVRVGWESTNLTVQVRDTGIGIAPDQLDRVFSPFEQADNSVSRRHEGTGLGLAISRRLASMLNGTLTAESAPGIGSVFTLTIECKPVEGTAWSTSIEAVKKTAPKSKEHASTLRGRVLLAEDGVDNQKLITYFLERTGLEVEVVANGREILDRFDTDSSYDLLITDMQMPVMDGYTATSCLREMGHTIPILALTAHAMGGDRERCLEAGCDEYEPKPIDRNSLIETVTRLLNRRAKPLAPHQAA